MAVTPRRQLQFWGLGTLVFVLLMWLLGDTLLPFFAGAAIAYFLDPIADRLERLGMGRAMATSTKDRRSAVATGMAQRVSVTQTPSTISKAWTPFGMVLDTMTATSAPALR